MDTTSTHELVLGLVVEARAASVVSELHDAGVPLMLLKGMTLERLLYGPDELRPCGDVDLIVPPVWRARAERRLHDLGVVNKYDGISPEWAEEHADSWAPTDGPVPVDLHRHLWGVGVDPAEAWDVLWADRTQLLLGTIVVDVPNPPARVLLAALHAAHHGPEHPRPVEDLSRAVHRLDAAVWAQARELADRLGATKGLAAGLELVNGGPQLRDRLALLPAGRESVVRVAELWSAPPTTAGILRLLDAATLRERATILRQELLPSRAFMVASAARDADRDQPNEPRRTDYVKRWLRLAASAPRGWRAARALRRRR